MPATKVTAINALIDELLAVSYGSGRTIEEYRAETDFNFESGMIINPDLPADITFIDFMESFGG